MKTNTNFRITCSLAVLASLLGCGLFQRHARADAPLGRAQMEAAFDSASREFDVPAPLLKAIGFVESKWYHKMDDHSDAAEPESGHAHQRAYGVMGLRNDAWFGHSLLEAAHLIQRAPEELIADPVLNIRGAAAYLKKLGRSEGWFFNWNWGTEADRLLAWTAAIKRYSGIPGPEEADLYASDVFSVLKDGYGKNGIFIASVGGVIPREVLEPRSALKQESAEAAEYPEAVWDRSGNFTADGTTGTHVVIHTTEGNFAGAVSWHKDPTSDASSHFIIRARDGYMKQLVKLKDRSWHARCWNKISIGIEHEAWEANPDSFTEPLYRASSKLVKFITQKLSIPIHPRRIIGHGFKSSVYFPGSGLEACNTHTDPGMFWDWEGYFALLGLSPMPDPAPPSAPVL